MKEQIEQVYIKWEVAGRQLLALSFNRSGSLNRAGDGSEEHAAYFFMGRADTPVFEAFMEQVDESLFEMAGRYTLPEPKGEIARLTLAFSGPELDTGFEFTYGTHSAGPAQEVVELLELALNLTQQWWEGQLHQRLSKQNKKKQT
ncbi:MAG: hypothetical protein D6730_15915 [Bacteroidetes bacterium]|nr:MAG: hypothetical protein D6730_15915 [Bacteroidota bacterium]